MAREYFCAYHSYLKATETLTDVERGRLFVALLEYSMTDVAPELRGSERHVFPLMREQIDRDKSKYDKQCEKNKRAAERRWETQMDASACERMQDDANICQDKDKGKGKGKGESKERERVAHASQKSINAFFESVWALYPSKKGKAHVSDKTKRKLSDIGIDMLSRCIDRYKADKPDWQEYQYGSTFFNGGYVDYLDDNYQQATVEQPSPDYTIKPDTDKRTFKGDETWKDIVATLDS